MAQTNLATIPQETAQDPSARGAPPVRMRTTRFFAVLGATGERFDFAASARTSADHTFRFVWTLAPGKKGPGEHFHEGETETFEVVSGRIRIWLAGEPKDYGPGDVCVVRPGVRHKFLNPGAEPVVINVSLDGPKMEDTLVPIAVAVAGRAPRLGDFLRMMAGLDAGASTPASGFERSLLSAMARALRAFGVQPYAPVIGWDAPEHFPA